MISMEIALYRYAAAQVFLPARFHSYGSLARLVMQVCYRLLNHGTELQTLLVRSVLIQLLTDLQLYQLQAPLFQAQFRHLTKILNSPEHGKQAWLLTQGSH